MVFLQQRKSKATMNYSEVLNYITEKNKLGSMPGISAIMELLKRLGNPEKKVKALHIAGTNGKGSIMAYAESVMILHGLKVGRYISPAIFDFREKWQINRKYISEEDCCDIISRIADVIVEMEDDGFRSPTTFEIETAAAFMYFAEENCDYMLIECGMGGKGDATNVFDHAVLNVMASVSFDHMQFLGNTLTEITKEKTGIVNEGDILVSYPQCEEVKSCIDEDAAVRGYSVIYPDTDSVIRHEEGIRGSRFSYKGHDYEISIAGDYQIYNAVTAIEILNNIPGLSFSEEEIRTGLKNTFWLGRMTIASLEPLFVVDGAHNRDAWIKLRDTLAGCFPDRKFVFILGVLSDKEYEYMLNTLCPLMKKAYTVTTSSNRAFDGGSLADMIKKRGVEAEFIDTENPFETVVRKALDDAYSFEDTIVACGTLSFAGYIINAVKEDRHNIILHDRLFRSRMDEINKAEENRKFCRHGMNHLLNVARIGSLVAKDEGIEIGRDIIYATALLHDIGRWSELEKTMDHSEAGAVYAEDILRRAGYSDAEISEIVYAIRCHGEDTEKKNSLAWLLYKADKMSRNCFNCNVSDKCFWDEDKKNLYIKY